MNTERFSASTQYEDLRGTVTADQAESGSMERWLQYHDLVQDGEHLVGASLFFGQLQATGASLVQVSFLLAPNETNLRVLVPGVDEAPTVVVRRVEKEIALSDFFRFFKRLKLTLSSSGEFEDRTYTYVG